MQSIYCKTWNRLKGIYRPNDAFISLKGFLDPTGSQTESVEIVEVEVAVSPKLVSFLSRIVELVVLLCYHQLTTN